MSNITIIKMNGNNEKWLKAVHDILLNKNIFKILKRMITRNFRNIKF